MGLPYDHRSVANTRHALRAKQTGSRVLFFRMAPSVDGERAVTTGKYAYSAPKMQDAIIRARIGVDEPASSNTMLRLSFHDNNMFLRVNRPSTASENRNSGATSFRATQTRQHQCALRRCRPPSLAPNSVLVSRSARLPS